jgi:two-component system, LytTR family, sensor kinase
MELDQQNAAGSRSSADDLSLTQREIVLVVAFWMLYAMLASANRIFDVMSRSGWDATMQSGWVVVPILDSLCWVLLTLPIFWLAARYGTGRVTRAREFALFAVVGIVVVVLVGILGTVFRTQFGGPPPGGRNRSFRPPPFWFGMLNAFVVYLGVVAAGFARAYSLRYRARHEQTNILERQLAEARLDALRRQLDPHFLFNTLNAVASLVERDPRGVRKMISRLGALLRFSLEGADAPEIPLRRELDLLQQYLDIMQVRFQGRLEVTMDTDARTLDALVPTLILQPLVENAIKHGIEPQRDGGRITIATRLEGDTVVLRVSDDGPGVMLGESPLALAGEAPTGGVGLRNTRARLAQLYGNQQRFTLARDDERGAVAEVRIPFHAAGIGAAVPAVHASLIDA